MNISILFILFGVVVLITHLLEGITGFGCTALALPFCTLLVGIKTAVPALVILAWILALYVIIIDHKHIVWRQFGKILLLVILGLPIGIILFSYMPETILKIVLGVFMILVATRGIYFNFKKIPSSGQIPGFLLNILLFLGGIIHGAFGSGGPFVVIYATKNLPQKSNFRATLCTLWFTLNSIIIIKDWSAGALTSSVINLLFISLPFLIAGMILGNVVHGKLNEKIFTKMIYVVLLVSGLFMFL
jgi:uncharacterized membrane protein YfcA